MPKTLAELKALNPRDFDDVNLAPEEVLEWFEICGAVWFHDGDCTKPHAELTSGLCSNGFVDCRKVFKFPNLTEILGRQVGWLIRQRLSLSWQGALNKGGWVISSPYAAITFGHEVAKELGVEYGHAEKDPTDPKGKRMVWQKLKIPANAYVLQVEELITTLGTTQNVRQAIIEGNGQPVNFIPVVVTLVHRPAKLPITYENTEVIPFIEKVIWAVKPPCELCQQGSKALRPSTHWQELTGKI